jgi:hypothetical protein
MMAAESSAVTVDAAAVDAVDAESRPGASLEGDLASGVGFRRGGDLDGASASTPAVAETFSEDRTWSEVTADEMMTAVLRARALGTPTATRRKLGIVSDIPTPEELLVEHPAMVPADAAQTITSMAANSASSMYQPVMGGDTGSLPMSHPISGGGMGGEGGGAGRRPPGAGAGRAAAAAGMLEEMALWVLRMRNLLSTLMK